MHCLGHFWAQGCQQACPWPLSSAQGAYMGHGGALRGTGGLHRAPVEGGPGSKSMHWAALAVQMLPSALVKPIPPPLLAPNPLFARLFWPSCNPPPFQEGSNLQTIAQKKKGKTTAYLLFYTTNKTYLMRLEGQGASWGLPPSWNDKS